MEFIELNMHIICILIELLQIQLPIDSLPNSNTMEYLIKWQ